MKVLFISTYYAPHLAGGVEVTLQALVEAIRSYGADVTVLTTSGKPGLQRERVNGVTVWRAGLRNVYWPKHNVRRALAARRVWHAVDAFNPLMSRYIRHVVRTEKPDVASVHKLAGWSVCTWVALRQEGVPSVQVLHDQYLICAATTMFKGGRNCHGQCTRCRLLRLPHRSLSGGLRGVVGVSQFVLDLHINNGYFATVRHKAVIHNARDPRALGVRERSRIPASGRKTLRFGFIGRLDPPKGIEWLLDAFVHLYQFDTELWVAGSGKKDYEEFLRKRFSDNRVQFLGRVAPSAFFPEVDVVVVPSLVEDNFPGAVFEAFAFGRPVIGSRRGGIPEMIRDRENGVLVDPDARDELHAAMYQLAVDRSLRQRMGVAARLSARRFTNVDQWVRDYVSVYSEAIRASS